MSGSPVYVSGKLIGAVSYSLSGSTSPIGGLTPASDMANVLAYSSAAAGASAPDRSSISIPAGLRGDIAAGTGVAISSNATLSRLPVPIAVSGLSAAGRAAFQEHLARTGYPIVVTPGGRATKPQGSPVFATPVPGGNFGAMISYGDVTAGGIGTTTYVCNGVALAFGHPLQFMGKSAFGANDAISLGIIADPVFGSYKLANVGALFGVVDQDRMAGIRTQLGHMPSLIPVTSSLTDTETGRSRNGESDVTMQQFVPSVAASHLYANLQTVLDEVTPGSSLLTWVVTGKRANGNPWTLTRTDRYNSSGDIAYDSVNEFYGQLSTIASFPNESVTVSRVSLTGHVTSVQKIDTIQTVLVSKNGGPYKQRQVLQVHVGDHLAFHAALERHDGTTHTVSLSLVVPDTAGQPAILTVSGGFTQSIGPGSDCQFDPSSCPNTFPELLQSLANATRNDSLTAAVLVENPATFEPVTAASSSRIIKAVVQGSIQIVLNVQ